MSTITAIILARNEEQHIADCIKSIQCADEILVIDDGSTDRTIEIAEDLGAKVIPHPLNGDWSQQRRLVFHKLRVNGFYLLTLMSVYHQS